jgi:two-component system sensor histidine kinase YesM
VRRELVLNLVLNVLVLIFVVASTFAVKACVGRGCCIAAIIVSAYSISRLGMVVYSLKHDKKSSTNESANTENAYEIKQNVNPHYLSNQINPHFLYNTLESIRGKAIMDNNHEIADMVEALSHLFRYNISNYGKLVPLSEELKNVDLYFNIQQFRFCDRFRLEKRIPEGLNNFYLPKLTLQPLIENALIHGLEKSKHSGTIILRIIETDVDLIIFVEDDGVGIEAEKLELINDALNSFSLPDTNEETGIALCNVNTRIKLLLGEEYGLRIYSTVSVGTTVEIRIPKSVPGNISLNRKE